jgi:hypothetical protein
MCQLTARSVLLATQLEGLFTNLGALVGLPPDGRVHIHGRADFEPLSLCIRFGDEE